MCGRYQLDPDEMGERLTEQVEEAKRLAACLGLEMHTSGEIRPTDIAPVLAPSAVQRRTQAFPMQWGFSHPYKGMLIFNTRSETAAEKDLFCTSIDDRRCLIPASCYFEWHKTEQNRKERYAFFAEDRKPLYLAGLYVRSRDWRQPPCFSILTRDAASNIKALHPRMPVLVPYEREEEWLSRDTDFHRFLASLQLPVRAERG